MSEKKNITPKNGARDSLGLKKPHIGIATDPRLHNIKIPPPNKPAPPPPPPKKK